MRRFVVTFILIIASFILQTTLFRYFDFGYIVPNLLIIMTCSFGFMRGDKSGIWVGFLCGILVDIMFGTYLGFYALIYMYIGFIVGQFSREFFRQNILLPILLIISGDFVYGFICYVLMFLFRVRLNLPYYMFHVIIPEMIYTTIVAVFLYPLLMRINNKLEEIEQRSAKKFV
ncbi:MAG: rod shape-determining protein MreD [Butyrivibrio sp.]|nr:rod shape-determining protein MreD [Butyrivibrio sp.]